MRICDAEGCTNKHYARGYCIAHYCRWQRYGDPRADQPIQDRVNKGHTYVHGYRVFQIDGRQRYEHRLVMEAQLGRPLRKGESVHHKNGVRSDNTLGNLELWYTGQPAGVHGQG